MDNKVLDGLLAATSDFEQDLVKNIDDIKEADEATCSVLVKLRDAIATLRYADELLVGTLGKKMKVPVTTDGVTLEAKWSKPTQKWDHEKLQSVVSEKIVELAMDPETGTIDVPPWALATRILDFAGISYWRTGKLKEVDIDPNEYREAGEPKVRIEIHGRK